MNDLLYLDSSALVKLVAPERETPALRALLVTRREVVSSAIARVEISRAARRLGDEQLVDRAREILSRIALVAVDEPVLRAAATLLPPNLRSLDAIHLATAGALESDLDAFVSYDRASESDLELKPQLERFLEELADRG